MRGYPCYSGVDTVWSQKSYDLSTYASQNVQLRFRFGSDAGTTNEGLYVDDALLYAPLATLSAPEQLTCATDSSNNVILQWSGAAPHYKIYTSTSMDGPLTLLGQTDLTTFTVVGGVNDILRFYVVTSWDGN